MVFGHGHPISSGIADAVDYFVSSELFERAPGRSAIARAPAVAIARAARAAADALGPGARADDGAGVDPLDARAVQSGWRVISIASGGSTPAPPASRSRM